MCNGKYCVYCHTAPNGKKYIGITQNCRRRWQNGRGYVRNAHFNNAILKYGWDNFSHEIVFDNLSKEKACELERELIARYKSNNPKFGYNNSLGGENPAYGRKYSPKEREHRRRIMLGNKHSLGYKHTEETRKRMREAQLRREHLPLTEAQKAQCTANLPPPKRGGKHPESKPILCVELNIVYPSGAEAAEALGLQKPHISSVCRGKRKTTGGYHFEFYEGEVWKE